MPPCRRRSMQGRCARGQHRLDHRLSADVQRCVPCSAGHVDIVSPADRRLGPGGVQRGLDVRRTESPRRREQRQQPDPSSEDLRVAITNTRARALSIGCRPARWRPGATCWTPVVSGRALSAVVPGTRPATRSTHACGEQPSTMREKPRSLLRCHTDDGVADVPRPAARHAGACAPVSPGRRPANSRREDEASAWRSGG